MNTDILKKDLLDILFHNKNKSYGAYQLRKYYPSRLKKAIGITAILAFTFSLLQSWKTPKVVSLVTVGDLIDLKTFDKPIEKQKEKIIEKTIERKTEQVKQVANTTIDVVPDIEVKNPIPSTVDLEKANIGLTNFEGKESIGIVGVFSGKPNTAEPNTSLPNNTTPIEEEFTEHPSEMPEFIGGVEAMKRYLLRNLAQPDDIEEGQRIVVLVKFIVDKKGKISDIEIEKSGREDLDDEVKKVIEKMPLWKPGLQNGIPINVIFRLPVSFVNGG